MSGDAARRFKTVILDVDSTLCGIEGIDWLAQLRGEDVAAQVGAQTDRAMRGEIPLESVYGQRLALVKPRDEEVNALAQLYVESIAPGALEAIASWQHDGVRVLLITSAIRQSILPLAGHIGVHVDDLHAVDIHFDVSGDFTDFDRTSPLTTAKGKHAIVSSLDLPRPVLAVGDGSTDLAIRGAAEAFAAFTGFVRRPAVAEHADFVVTSFDELSTIVLGRN